MSCSLGKSGYLPDISSAFSFWRSYSVNCLDHENYNGAASGLNNINSLLTEDYIISVDTTQYKKQTGENIVYLCPSCEKETSQNNIKFGEITLSSSDAIITGRKKERKWYCINCNAWMSQRLTSVIKDKLASPFYRRVVSECPVQAIGLGSKLNFAPQFDTWFYNFLEELQHALALYRIEYIAQNDGEDMADVSIKPKVELQ